MKGLKILLCLSLVYVSSFLLAQSPFDIVQLSDVSHTALASGDWTSSSTWGGSIPSSGARVHIPAGIEVRVDGLISQRIKTLRLDGKLYFRADVNTQLRVESIIGSTNSELEIGTAANPIQENVSASIVFIDEGPLNTNLDYGQFGKGLVMMGKTRAFGHEKSSWHSLQQAPLAGDNTITLSEVPVNWTVGDEIVISGTRYNDPESDEKRIISAIDGNVISLNQALGIDHNTPSNEFKVHVANLSRNIIFSSENSTVKRRGHVMFMHNLDVDINNVRFYQLGRTDKRVQVDDWFFPTLVADEYEAGDRTNIRGRYSCHFHRGGVDPVNTSPAKVRSCVVEDDPGWAYVNHSSNVEFTDNVSYNIMGGAFQTESGDEIGSFERNIAIRTVNPNYPILNPDTEPVDIREDSQDFAFQGDAFWVHGGGVSLNDNVASGCSGHGFIFWTEGQREVNTEFDLQNMFKVSNIPNGDLLPGLENIQSWWIPLKSFKGNTAYSATKGFAGYYIHATLFEDITELTDAYLETVHSYIEDLKIWNVRKYGIELHNCERFTFKNLKMQNEGDEEVIGIFNTISVARESKWLDCEVKGFGVGMIPAMQGHIQVCGGTFSNQWDFQLVPPQRDSRGPGWDRDIIIDGISFEDSPYFSDDDIIHFKMEGESTLQSEIPFVEAEFQNMFFLIPDRIMVNMDGLENKRLFYNEQAASYTPINDYNIYDAFGAFEDDVLNKTNQDLYDDFQLAFAGALLPSDASTHSFVSGGKISDQDPLMKFPACHYLDEDLLPANSYDDYDFYECWASSSSPQSGDSSPAPNNCAALVDVKNTASSMSEIKVYPNPATDYIQVEALGSFTAEIFSMDGRLLLSEDDGNKGQQVDVSSLKAGLYFIRISSEKEAFSTAVLKFVKN